jgi:adenylate cyclase
MAVAGAPTPSADHAKAALELARDILLAVGNVQPHGAPALEVRIGLASGAVMAGVIGQRRILFDLWGDTVNLAARMESSGVPGRIQVAPATRDLLGDTCAFVARQVEVKGIGPMTAYLVA